MNSRALEAAQQQPPPLLELPAAAYSAVQDHLRLHSLQVLDHKAFVASQHHPQPVAAEVRDLPETPQLQLLNASSLSLRLLVISVLLSRALRLRCRHSIFQGDHVHPHQLFRRDTAKEGFVSQENSSERTTPGSTTPRPFRTSHHFARILLHPKTSFHET